MRISAVLLLFFKFCYLPAQDAQNSSDLVIIEKEMDQGIKSAETVMVNKIIKIADSLVAADCFERALQLYRRVLSMKPDDEEVKFKTELLEEEIRWRWKVIAAQRQEQRIERQLQAVSR